MERETETPQGIEEREGQAGLEQNFEFVKYILATCSTHTVALPHKFRRSWSWYLLLIIPPAPFQTLPLLHMLCSTLN